MMLSWLMVTMSRFIVFFSFVSLFMSCTICLTPSNLAWTTRVRQVTVGARSRYGKSGQLMAQRSRWRSWWKKTLGQRCSSCNLKHYAWCRFHLQWQSMTLNIPRMDTHWSLNPIRLRSIVTSTLACISPLILFRHRYIQSVWYTERFNVLTMK